MNIFLERQIADVKVIADEKRYWFIRTYSGEAYSDYLEGKYVGVGVNNVPYDRFIKGANFNDEESYSNLHKYVQNNTKYKKGEATKITNQLISFNSEMKKGDTVIIPSRGSSELAFGTITSDLYLVEKPGTIQTNHKLEELPEKRRRVHWDKVVSREKLQGDLRGMLASHQGVTNADEYSTVIEGALESCFIKDEQMYLVIQIKQDEDINAFDLKRFLEGLTFFYQEFCKENGLEINEELSIKIKLQSRGKTILKAGFYAGILGLLGLIALSNNNSFKAEIGGVKVEGKSDGFLKSISDFLDRNQKRKEEYALFQDSIARLRADDKPLSGENLKDSANKFKEHRKKK